MKRKYEIKALLMNTDIVTKYDLKNKWEKYSKIVSPKRGRQRESISDVKNKAIRALLDLIFGTPGSLKEAWIVGVSIFDGNCYICDELIYDADGQLLENVSVQADHIVPPIAGGTISAGNMIAAHRVCNNQKGNADFEEFLKSSPDKIQKIRDYQNLYNYEKPNAEVLKKVLELFSTNFDKFIFDTLNEAKDLIENSRIDGSVKSNPDK